MAEKKQNRRNKNYDDDYNQDLENKEKKFAYYVVTKL